MTPPPDSVAPAVMTKEEAAAYLSTTVRHVRRLVYERRIPYMKVGRLVRFGRADLDAYLMASRVEMRAN